MLPLSYSSFLYGFEPIPGLSILFCCYTCLFICQRHSGLMTEVLQYKSTLNPPPHDAFQDILKQMGPPSPSNLNVLYVSDP